MKFKTAMILPFLYGSENGPCTNFGGEPIHLRQSELDGACGQHCLFMALLALGVVKKKDLYDLDEVDGEFGKVWKRARKSFFEGTYSADIINILKPLKTKINFENIAEKNNGLRNEIVFELNKENLVMLFLRKNRNVAHWVLVVGMQGLLDCKQSNINELCKYDESYLLPNNFLVLDPSSDPLPFLPWNAVLEVNSPPNGYRKVEYISGKHSDKYKIEGAVSIGF